MLSAVAANSAYASSPDIESAVIRVATHIEPPLVYLDGQEFVGSNVEVGKLLAASIGYQIEFVQCPFARCLYQTQIGQADMMIGINKTSERQRHFEYLSKPYSSVITPVKFYLNNDSVLKIARYEDLIGKKIGVLRGAVYFKPFDDDNRLTKVPVVNHEQLIDMLLNKRIDTFLARDLSVRKRASDVEYLEKMQAAQFTYQKQQDMYIAVSKKSQLVNKTAELSNKLAELISSGQVAKIVARYH
ncbi:amino acid ABC transporter periplasmic protein [Catenovulum agarivorans DS-2]|uniref:Amino acid ABC transporter periplasmic protein n=2 Tax=Catenovulum agarivorans TaxID=1172192 RepID=W7QBB6_9ALTE|nr:amino acid ABC transporter periplasmic protein [Catenovulum agarivorans DS-2]